MVVHRDYFIRCLRKAKSFILVGLLMTISAMAPSTLNAGNKVEKYDPKKGKPTNVVKPLVLWAQQGGGDFIDWVTDWKDNKLPASLKFRWRHNLDKVGFVGWEVYKNGTLIKGPESVGPVPKKLTDAFFSIPFSSVVGIDKGTFKVRISAHTAKPPAPGTGTGDIQIVPVFLGRLEPPVTVRTIESTDTQFTSTERYVAPVAIGDGTGESAAHAASYLDNAFWAQVDDDLQSNAIEVVFLDGVYTGALILNSIGHPQTWLILRGQSKTGVLFDSDPAIEKSLGFRAARNVTLRHLHFTGQARKWAVHFYGNRSYGVVIDSCSFKDLHYVKYGAIGIVASDLEIRNSHFERVGLDNHAHMLYSTSNNSNLRVLNNIFIDCSGEYVRFRNRNSDVTVEGNIFFHTGVYTETERIFVSIPLFNDVNPGDEEFVGESFNYRIADNHFAFATFKPDNNAIWVRHWGYNPPGFQYLLTDAEGQILEGGSTADKAALIESHYGFGVQAFDVQDNCCTNCDRYFALNSERKFGAENISQGWDGTAEVYEVFRPTEVSDMYDCPGAAARSVAWSHFSTTSGFGYQSAYQRLLGFDPSHKWRSGDFDDDGDGDLVNIYSAGGDAAVWLHLKGAMGFEMRSSVDIMAGFWPSQKWIVGDFDGDGKDDLVNVYGKEQPDGKLKARAWVHRSTGKGFEYQSSFTEFAGFWDTQRWLVGDFDGDGKDDLVNVYGKEQPDGKLKARAWVHCSMGKDKGFEKRSSFTEFAGFWNTQRWLVGDFNGDGKDDLVNVYGKEQPDGKLKARAWVHRSMGKDKGFEYQSSFTEFAGFWNTQRWLVGNFDNDEEGKDDLVNIYGNLW